MEVQAMESINKSLHSYMEKGREKVRRIKKGQQVPIKILMM